MSVSVEKEARKMIGLLTRIMVISNEMDGAFLNRGGDDTPAWVNESELRDRFSPEAVDEFVECHERLRKIGQKLLDGEEYEGNYDYQKTANRIMQDYFMEHRELCVTGVIPQAYLQQAWSGLGGLFGPKW